MNGPAPPAQRFFFSPGPHAAEHLCDHVLTRPEAHNWAVVLPYYSKRVSDTQDEEIRRYLNYMEIGGELVNPTDDAKLWRIAASLFCGNPSPEARVLLKLYVAAILHNIEDALRLGFWWEQRQGKYQEWFGLGLDGVYVIWDREVIQTGYFPGSASFQPPGETLPRTENPLPRRDPAKQFRPPPPDSPRRRLELFQNGLYCFSRKYATAYAKEEIAQEGGGPFVDCDPPRMGRWQRWRNERPRKTS